MGMRRHGGVLRCHGRREAKEGMIRGMKNKILYSYASELYRVKWFDLGGDCLALAPLKLQ